MSTTPGDAPVNESNDALIPALAELYDRFAHALDPLSDASYEAERIFQTQLAVWYDSIQGSKPTFHEFRKGVIVRCRRHLATTNKPQDKGILRSPDKTSDH
jgi:hypothetical protein